MKKREAERAHPPAMGIPGEQRRRDDRASRPEHRMAEDQTDQRGLPADRRPPVVQHGRARQVGLARTALSA